MFGHKLGLHIIQFPSGRWGYVGGVPTDLARAIPASTSAILGCRSWKCPKTGESMEWKFPTFETAKEAAAFAQSKGHAPMLDNVPQVA